MRGTLTEKILQPRLGRGRLVTGDEVGLRADQLLLQDATGTMAWLQFEELGVPRVRVPLAVQYVDHNMVQLDSRNPDDHRYLQSLCARYGVLFSRPGNGISHYVHLERFSRPGVLLVGADSHTTMGGAVGMLAIGAGGLDAALLMAGDELAFRTPAMVEVRLSGRLKEWVQAKDVILELLRRRTVRGGRNRIFEFTGEGAETLSVTERATICNMIAELGATAAIFPSDERVQEWLREQGRAAEWTPLAADHDAEYDEIELIQLDGLQPLIACPSSPDNVVPVADVAGRAVAQVCIGSSVNSGYEDLAAAAAVLRGATVHPDTVMTATPGSRQILQTIVESGVYGDLIGAGVRMLEPVCGPCVGMGQAPPSGGVSVRTFNRNFPGRSGSVDDVIYLASPATAAATALRGVLTDPRTLGDFPTFRPRARLSEPVDGLIVRPPVAAAAATVQVIRGPNIESPPAQTPLPTSVAGRVLLVLGDDISTGDLSPDGANVMAFRSNITMMSRFVLRRIDPGFVGRARDWGGGLLVAGENYGQGSSREHAVLAPKALGVRAVVAKSFARLHRRNLIAQGLPPLTFVDPEDHALANQGETWVLEAIRRDVADGRLVTQCRILETDARLDLAIDLTDEERTVLLDGGLIASFRKRQAQKVTAAQVEPGGAVV